MIIWKTIVKLFFVTSLPIAIMFISGCFVGDKVIRPVKVNDIPNTFKLSEQNWGGTLIYVKVFDSTYTNTVWHIEATQEIPVKSFTITVGDIPKGFKQIVPSDGTKYTPNSGTKYVIGIEAHFNPPAWSLGETWIAD